MVEAPLLRVVPLNVWEEIPMDLPIRFSEAPPRVREFPLLIRSVGVPRFEKFKPFVPPLIVKPPVKVLTAEPLSTSVPTPALVNPAAPAIAALMVTDLPAPRALTVIVGVVAARVRIFPAIELLSSVQPATDVVAVSPKARLPTVRGESRWTVLSVVISTVTTVPLRFS